MFRKVVPAPSELSGRDREHPAASAYCRPFSRRRSRLRILISGLAVALAITSRVTAININLVYDAANSSAPSVDPNGDQLMNITGAAVDIWEDIIEDNHDMTIKVVYDDTITGFTFATAPAY